MWLSASNGGGLWICMFWQLPCTIFLIVVQTKLFAVNLSQHEVIENDEDDKEYEYEANDSAQKPADLFIIVYYIYNISLIIKSQDYLSTITGI